jgi:DNA excision repair protein ERCC-2
LVESSKRSLSVSVRDLVEFVLRTGDLGGERDFVGPTRALEGTRGHQRVQRSRPEEYKTEVFVSYRIETEELALTIKGRIDGLWPTSEGVLLEEIKTTLGRWNGLPDPLHWAQGKIYAFVYSAKEKLEHITVQLTYLDLDSQKLTEFRQTFRQVELAAFFHEVTAVYLEWVTEHHRWCQRRDASIRFLPFPFSKYRPGQRSLCVSAYRVITRSGTLFAEAPTGIGKTISVLFPAVKALAEGTLERIFYLTAKTVGRTVAEKAFAEMRNAGLHVRTITLTAKEKICLNEGQACDVSNCPLARGYYDRVKGAMKEAFKTPALTRRMIEEIARGHQICPFELSLDLSLWVDAIICDYNYVFDPAVYLRRYFSEETLDCGFLIDEAHNLVDRAREMFSADLRQENLLAVNEAIQSALPGCAIALQQVLQHVLEKRKQAVEGSSDDSAGEASLVQAEAPDEMGKLAGLLLQLQGRGVGLLDEGRIVLGHGLEDQGCKNGLPPAVRSTSVPVYRTSPSYKGMREPSRRRRW